MRRRSKKRAKEEREYSRIAKEILAEGHICPVTGEPATQIHHMKGRIGPLLTDRRWMLPVSHNGHVKIELNPAWAKEMGFSLSRLAKEETVECGVCWGGGEIDINEDMETIPCHNCNGSGRLAKVDVE